MRIEPAATLRSTTRLFSDKEQRMNREDIVFHVQPLLALLLIQELT